MIDPAQPTAKDLDTLFHIDPENLTEQDTAQLVVALREKREKFEATEATKAKAKSTPKPVAPVKLLATDIKI